MQMREDADDVQITSENPVTRDHRRQSLYVVFIVADARFRVDFELDKDDAVLGHGTQRAYDPRQIGNDVFSFSRVDENTGTVGDVAK